MRTTMDLDADALMAAKELACVENTSLGKVVSRLIRRALTGEEIGGAAGLKAQAGPAGNAASCTGFAPFAPRGSVVSNALIEHWRDAEGV